MKRGRWIRYIVILLILILTFTGCMNSQANKNQEIFESTGFMLGTVISIKLQKGGSKELLDDLFNKLVEIENLMSTSIEGSDVKRINDSAGEGIVPVSKETMVVVKKAIEYSELSKGYFDITLGPLIDLWKIGTPEATIPKENEIIKALDRVDYHKIIIEDQKIGLKDKKMRMDLGGIAKGYAADVLVTMAEEAGVISGIINLGGNVRVIGSSLDGGAYKIGIQNPFSKRNTYLGIVKAKDQTVVTSGSYERYFEVDGKRYHHIFNKDTGYPIDNSIAAVTVVTNSSIDADALSTILYILGKEKGLALIDTLKNVECIYITHENKIYLSEGMKDIFTLTDNSFTIKEP